MRYVLLITTCLLTVNVFGLDKRQWVQVAGGSWETDDKLLAKLEVKLKRKFKSHVRYIGPGDRWENYTFQYQGRILPTGQKIIDINAFCSNIPEDWIARYKLTNQWVRIYGGGGCLFQASYNVDKSTIFNFKVNAPK